MKTTMKKALAALLALVMLCGAMPFAFAAEDDVTVALLFSHGDKFCLIPEFTVADGAAEAYGYTVAETDLTGAPVNGVTVLDALVTLHKELYGDAFTAETAENYLVVAPDTGYITKIDGVATINVSFTVNDAFVHDDEISEWGTYTGFSCNETVLKDGDKLNVFFYQDSYAMDLYPLIEAPEKVDPGEEFTVSATGYFIGWYGYSPADTIAEMIEPLSDAEVVLFSDDLKTVTTLGTLDDTGALTISFEEAGTYWVGVRGEEAGESGAPAILNAVCVQVGTDEPPVDEQPSLFQRVINAVKDAVQKVIDFFRSVFDTIAGLFK
ncbi:MAG: hypothetical protein IK080_02975 [Clostridia bacterium]|nr:hypothetical protein [Clostridia bacterium]